MKEFRLKVAQMILQKTNNCYKITENNFFDKFFGTNYYSNNKTENYLDSEIVDV